MIRVAINGPLGEDNIRLLGAKELAKVFRALIVDHRTPVVLRREDRSSFEYAARFRRFGCTDRATLFKGFSTAVPFPAIEVEDRYIVTQVRVTGDGTSTSTLRIAGMTARDKHLQLSPGSLNGQSLLLRLGRGKRRHSSDVEE